MTERLLGLVLLLGLTSGPAAGQETTDGHAERGAALPALRAVTPVATPRDPAELPDPAGAAAHPHPLLPLLATKPGPPRTTEAKKAGPTGSMERDSRRLAHPDAFGDGDGRAKDRFHAGLGNGDGPAKDRFHARLGAGGSFLASLALPGASQWARGQRRAWIYGGAELLGWAFFAQGRSEGSRFREDYRDLAWRIARVNKGPGRVEGNFRYYEAVGAYPASGAWDADPEAEGLQPESDPATYNGMIWSLARDLYLAREEEPDAEDLEQALEYYQERGFPPELAWDWSGNDSRRAEYRDLIERSDDGFRRATVFLGAVVANHLLSAVDGYISARITAERAPSATAFRTFRPARPPSRWTLELRLDRLP